MRQFVKEKCPLTGKICSKHKCIHITEVQNNKAVASVTLCENCAPAYVQSQNQSQVTQFVQDLAGFISDAIGVTSQQTELTDKVCPKCNISMKDIVDHGKFGCPQCYDSFNVDGLLKNLHGAIKHVGKKPKHYKSVAAKALEEKKRVVPIELRIKGMEAKMQQAAEQEKYELAAIFKRSVSQMVKLKKSIDELKLNIERASANKDMRAMQELNLQINKLMDECSSVERATAFEKPPKAFLDQ